MSESLHDELKTDEERARDLINLIDRYLKKWVAWYPSDASMVEVPRRDLLALKKFAEIGLRQSAVVEYNERNNHGMER